MQEAVRRTRQRRSLTDSSQKEKKFTLNELSGKDKKHFGEILTPNFIERELLFGFINTQFLPKTRRGGKKSDLTHLMSDMKFDHIFLTDTSSHCHSLQEEYRIPQIFRGHFMIQQLDPITACNENDPFLGPFQYGGTSSVSNRNLTGRKTAPGKDPYGIGRGIQKKFRVQGKDSLRIATLYRSAPPVQSTGPGLVYSQHLTYLNSTTRRICPRQGFLKDMKEEADKCKNSET